LNGEKQSKLSDQKPSFLCFWKKSKRIPYKVRYLLNFQCVENCSFYKNGAFFK